MGEFWVIDSDLAECQRANAEEADFIWAATLGSLMLFAMAMSLDVILHVL